MRNYILSLVIWVMACQTPSTTPPQTDISDPGKTDLTPYSLFDGKPERVDLIVAIIRDGSTSNVIHPKNFMVHLNGDGIFPSPNNEFIIAGDVNSNTVTYRLPTNLGNNRFTTPGFQGYKTIFAGACDLNGNFTQTAGEIPVCTLTLDDLDLSDNPAILHVQVVIQNDLGDPKSQSDFRTTINNVQITDAEKVKAKSYTRLLAPGLFKIRQATKPEYEQSFSGDCASNGDINLAAGDEKTCMITASEIGSEHAVPSISLTKTGVYAPGTNTINYLITYTVGDADATNLIITDQLTIGTPIYTSDNGAVENGLVTWNLGPKKHGASGSVEITVQLPSSSPYPDRTFGLYQGARLDGSPVLKDRTKTKASLGAPQSSGGVDDQDDTQQNSYWSPGIGGSVTFQFPGTVLNGEGNDLCFYSIDYGVTESYNRLLVEVANKKNDQYRYAGIVGPDGCIDLDENSNLDIIRHVKVTDITSEIPDISVLSTFSDGYNLDAIEALFTGQALCDVCNTADTALFIGLNSVTGSTTTTTQVDPGSCH